ncbi:hypothetical protein N1028_16815 [Herbiconiux sp. CPCC 203407]|uniref:Uncharacterized protein n=1 Tax=Herbiconiux oxytropis TaxID=2970915 RepID=A0AA41XIV6_9MICO|nr:hypothetical protein [Herbiconiux oxytropis]MCS5724240.1 hypothetical protein [Herbiconiux oxytropis]MCS5727558.1 hypothetical protein [Herbiconiux oxytropis]
MMPATGIGSGQTTVGLFDADAGVLAQRAEVLSQVPGVDLRIAAGSLGQMLTDPAFPPDVVIVQQREGERVSINYKIRVCRLADARVIVVSNGSGESLAHDVGSMMTPVTSFDEAVALIRS